ncbi:MAG: hypothetical protein PVS2B1_05820 [Candidatus Dormibacteraceae bacterium]
MPARNNCYLVTHSSDAVKSDSVSTEFRSMNQLTFYGCEQRVARDDPKVRVEQERGGAVPARRQ